MLGSPATMKLNLPKPKAPPPAPPATSPDKADAKADDAKAGGAKGRGHSQRRRAGDASSTANPSSTRKAVTLPSTKGKSELAEHKGLAETSLGHHGALSSQPTAAPASAPAMPLAPPAAPTGGEPTDGVGGAK